MLTTITNWIIFAAANLYNTLMGHQSATNKLLVIPRNR
jgi:hypothetical protein